jgi:hypothetical protein
MATGRRQGSTGGWRANVGGVHERNQRRMWQRTSFQEEALATPVVVARFPAARTTSNGEGQTLIVVAALMNQNMRRKACK